MNRLNQFTQSTERTVNSARSDRHPANAPERGGGTDADPTAVAPITRVAFAKLAGVSRAAVTQACRGALGKACDDRGNIFAEHPAAQAYVAAKNTTGVTDADVERVTVLAVRVGARVVVRAARWLLHRAERLEKAAQ